MLHKTWQYLNSDMLFTLQWGSPIPAMYKTLTMQNKVVQNKFAYISEGNCLV